jgi:hypothetical protein
MNHKSQAVVEGAAHAVGIRSRGRPPGIHTRRKSLAVKPKLKTDFYTVEDVIQILNISKTTLRAAIKRGVIPKPLDFNPFVRRWHKEVFDRFLESLRQRANEEAELALHTVHGYTPYDYEEGNDQ